MHPLSAASTEASTLSTLPRNFCPPVQLPLDPHSLPPPQLSVPQPRQEGAQVPLASARTAAWEFGLARPPLPLARPRPTVRLKARNSGKGSARGIGAVNLSFLSEEEWQVEGS